GLGTPGLDAARIRIVRGTWKEASGDGAERIELIRGEEMSTAPRAPEYGRTHRCAQGRRRDHREERAHTEPVEDVAAEKVWELRDHRRCYFLTRLRDSGPRSPSPGAGRGGPGAASQPVPSSSNSSRTERKPVVPNSRRAQSTG